MHHSYCRSVAAWPLLWEKAERNRYWLCINSANSVSPFTSPYFCILVPFQFPSYLTQSPYLHNFISVQRLCSTCSSSATDNILSKSNRSLLSLYFTFCHSNQLPLYPFISSSTSVWYQFLYFRFTYSFTHHFFLV